MKYKNHQRLGENKIMFNRTIIFMVILLLSGCTDFSDEKNLKKEAAKQADIDRQLEEKRQSEVNEIMEREDNYWDFSDPKPIGEDIVNGPELEITKP